LQEWDPAMKSNQLIPVLALEKFPPRKWPPSDGPSCTFDTCRNEIQPNNGHQLALGLTGVMKRIDYSGQIVPSHSELGIFMVGLNMAQGCSATATLLSLAQADKARSYQ
jgi:hypothetical protein